MWRRIRLLHCPKGLSGWCWCVLVLGSLVACGAAPARPFTTRALLLTRADLPAGWESGTPFTPSDPCSRTRDCAAVFFDSPATPNKVDFSQYVVRYENARQAAARFVSVNRIPPRDATIPALTLPPVAAAQHHLVCYPVETRTSCSWTAQYEEYVIELFVNVIPDAGPGQITLEQLAALIARVDRRMTDALRQPTS